ncbi:hypothetical protein EDB19DRAFT_1945380, partial [Suillus lakei]
VNFDLNHIDDFCLWAPFTPNSTLGDTEQEEVAWCTKPGHGTRLIPNGALQGVQLLHSWFIDQTQIDITLKTMERTVLISVGNPLGGLMYSNAFPSKQRRQQPYQQVIDWTNPYFLSLADVDRPLPPPPSTTFTFVVFAVTSTRCAVGGARAACVDALNLRANSYGVSSCFSDIRS